jgi:hypothetical protein
MAPLASLDVHRNLKRRETKSHEQVDLFALMLQVQTLTLQVQDLRNRLAQVERQLDIHHFSPKERAALSKLISVA